jgi:hypothetical protein
MGFLLKYRSGPSWIWLFYVGIFLIGFVVGFLVFNYFALMNDMK